MYTAETTAAARRARAAIRPGAITARREGVIGMLAEVSAEELAGIMSSQRKMTAFIRANSDFIYSIIHRVHGTYKVGYRGDLVLENIMDDLYSHGMMAMWRGLTRYDRGMAKLSTYLYTVVFRDVKREYDRHVLYHVRHVEIEAYAKRDENGEATTEYNEYKFNGGIGRSGAAMEDDVMRSDTFMYIGNHFEPRTRAICHCMFVLKMTNVQIQAHLGISKSEFESAWYRDRKKVAKLIRKMMKI